MIYPGGAAVTTTTTLSNHNRVTAPSRRPLVRGRCSSSNARAHAHANASANLHRPSASAFEFDAGAINFSGDRARQEVVRLRSSPSSFLLACCFLLPTAAQGFVPPCLGGGGAAASSLLRQHHQHQHRSQYQGQEQRHQGLSALTLLSVGRSSSVSGSGSRNGSRSVSGGGSYSCSGSILGGDGRLFDLGALDRLGRAVGGRPPPSALAASTTPSSSAAVAAPTLSAKAAASATAAASALTPPATAAAENVLSADITTATTTATIAAASPVADGINYSQKVERASLPALAVGVARRRFSAACGAALRAVRGATAVARSAATPIRRRRAAGVALISAAAFCFSRRPALAAAAGGAVVHGGRSLMGMIPSAPAGGVAQVGADMTLRSVAPKLALWFTLFVTSAAFHSAEIAITTLYPWKVKEFAEEEGENSPFQVLNTDITRVLTTILVATTVCTIYNAALFTNLAIQMFGSAGLAYATAALTVTTLFFGELLPKAMGVNNAEVVARRILPVIIVLSVVLDPVAKSFTLISKLMLSMLGFKSTETGRVSEEELRLIVTGAKMSGGIESQEGMMIEGVLDLQDTKISEIMRPRVEVVAIEANSTMMDLYTLHQETKYSRIPVYSGEIDRISGVVLSKDLLDFVQDPEKLSSVLVADETESTYFVPETMSVWNVLEEMRRRRLHMAIVVDEYGGTAGVVTLEDILEEVVGEIYDEKEDEEFRDEEHYINVNEDGSFTIHGMADLEDVCTSLAFREVNEDDLKEFGTLSGYLCSQAGEIPAAGDYVMVGGYMFTVTKADERRIEEVHARLIGTSDDAGEGEGGRAGVGGKNGSDQERNGGQSLQDEGAGAGNNADRPASASGSSGNQSQ